MKISLPLVLLLLSALFLTGCSTFHRVPVVTAAYKGDIPSVKAQIAAGADINEKGAIGDTIITGCPSISAVTAAAKYGHPEIVTLLLKHGADPDIAMLAAGAWKQTECIEAMLACGIPIDHTAIIQAAAMNCPDVIKVFLDHGADVNGLYNGQTMLTAACHANAAEAVKLLLAYKADVNLPANVMVRSPVAPTPSPVTLTQNSAMAVNDPAMLAVTVAAPVAGGYTPCRMTPLQAAKNQEIKALLRAAGAK